MQQHHERLLREAEDEQKVLRENFKTIERKLIMTENVYVCYSEMKNTLQHKVGSHLGDGLFF